MFQTGGSGFANFLTTEELLGGLPWAQDVCYARLWVGDLALSLFLSLAPRKLMKLFDPAVKYSLTSLVCVLHA